MNNLNNKASCVGIIDSQSIIASNRAENKGYDDNKKVKGRKRHIVVNTEGNNLLVIEKIEKSELIR